MRRMSVVVVFLMFVGCSLSAQQSAVSQSSTVAPTRAQVVAFMEVMQVRERLQSMLQTQQEEMTTVTHNMFNKALPDATPAQKSKFEEIVAGALGNLLKDYPVDDVLRDMITIYQKHFSESDLKQITAFYSSSVGQKVLREIPAIYAETTRISRARLQPNVNEMMKSLHSRIHEIADQKEK